MPSQTRRGNSENASEAYQLLLVLARRWRLILALTLVSALAAGLVSVFRLPNFEATQIVVIPPANFQFQFNPFAPQTSVSDGTPDYEIILVSALSEDLVGRVLSEVRASGIPGASALENLDGALEAKAPDSPSVIHLTATAHSIDLAAEIVDTWARRYVDDINRTYLRRTVDREFFAGQVVESKSRWEDAQQGLIDFQAQSGLSILQAQLGAKTDLLRSVLETQNTLALLQQRLDAIQTRLSGLPADGKANLGEELAAIVLQLETLGLETGVPLSIQLPGGEELLGMSNGQLADYLAALEQSAATQIEGLSASSETLPEEIQLLQGQIEEASGEESRLKAERDVAQETYIALLRKLDEVDILAQSAEGGAQISSQGVPTIVAAGPGLVVATVLAGGLGLLIGILSAFALEYLSPAFRDEGRGDKAQGGKQG
jgi:uncharacterized protein involved in exopolysaccharide biosynthesis